MKKIKKVCSADQMSNNFQNINNQKFYVMSNFEFQENENLFFQEESINKLERQTKDPYMVTGDSIQLLRDGSYTFKG
jgi:cob(I)alamin adenosyltransferase